MAACPDSCHRCTPTSQTTQAPRNTSLTPHCFMFDIGFSEMVVIGMVALIVIGPEKLPKVARTVGILLGRAQRYVNDVKSDINRQIQVEELKQLQEQMTQQARALENSIKQDVHSVEADLNKSIAPPGDTFIVAVDHQSTVVDQPAAMEPPAAAEKTST